MDATFTKKVHTAAVAGWWTLLIIYGILLIQWFAFVLIMSKQPEGLLCWFGKGMTWSEIRTIWLWGMVAYKLGVAMILFVVIWLTFWARQLAKK